MAFELDFNPNSTIEIVCSKDKALKMEKAQFKNYVQSGGNKDHLEYVEGMGWEDTTRFVFRRVVPIDAAKKVMNEQASGEIRDGEMVPVIKLGYVFEEIRAGLINIINPEGAVKPLEFKKDSDQLASKGLIGIINGAKILDELHTAWQKAIGGQEEANLEKKS